MASRTRQLGQPLPKLRNLNCGGCLRSGRSKGDDVEVDVEGLQKAEELHAVEELCLWSSLTRGCDTLLGALLERTVDSPALTIGVRAYAGSSYP